MNPIYPTSNAPAVSFQEAVGQGVLQAVLEKLHAAENAQAVANAAVTTASYARAVAGNAVTALTKADAAQTTAYAAAHAADAVTREAECRAEKTIFGSAKAYAVARDAQAVANTTWDLANAAFAVATDAEEAVCATRKVANTTWAASGQALAAVDVALEEFRIANAIYDRAKELAAEAFGAPTVGSAEIDVVHWATSCRALKATS